MKILIGNLFESKMHTLVNTVNCVGVMGKGVALEFKKRYPKMYEEYSSLCEQKYIHPGIPYYYTDLTGTSILLFPTKDHWRSPSRIEYIINGLKWFADHFQELGIKSIAFPPLGCGNGGLSWETVGPIMYRELSKLPIEIEIYAPYGTKPEQLQEDYLVANYNGSKQKSGRIRGKINDRWYIILEVIRRVNAGKHTLHVGRVIFQKICYILTRCGIQTGFTFVQGLYGPYSSDVNEAITILSNSNLMDEKQVDGQQMIEVNVGKLFSLDRSKYKEWEMQRMEDCIDLFCRVKNTDHAEMMTTVIFAYDQIIKEGCPKVTEQNILDAVLKWKSRWKNSREEKIKETIQDLAMLGWIHPDVSFMSPDDLF